MPAFEDMDRHQCAVLWLVKEDSLGRPVSDAYGQPQIDATGALEIKVRWVKRLAQMLDPNGNSITTDGTVVVGRRIGVGSILWEGRLRDIPGTSHVPGYGLMEVTDYRETPSIDNKHKRRAVTVQRYKDSLPSITS